MLNPTEDGVGQEVKDSLSSWKGGFNKVKEVRTGLQLGFKGKFYKIYSFFENHEGLIESGL